MYHCHVWDGHLIQLGIANEFTKCGFQRFPEIWDLAIWPGTPKTRFSGFLSTAYGKKSRGGLLINVFFGGKWYRGISGFRGFLIIPGPNYVIWSFSPKPRFPDFDHFRPRGPRGSGTPGTPKSQNPGSGQSGQTGQNPIFQKSQNPRFHDLAMSPYERVHHGYSFKTQTMMAC
jgi:hypothetical protein